MTEHFFAPDWEMSYAEDVYEVLCLADIGLTLPNERGSLDVLGLISADVPQEARQVFIDCFMKVADRSPEYSFHQILNIVKRGQGLFVNAQKFVTPC